MLLSAFILGILGSVHCVVMCGPLVVAFSKQMSSFKLKFLQQLGRLLGYTLLGLLMGLLGNTLALFSIQQKVSIGIGVLLIIMTLSKTLKKRVFGSNNGSFFFKIQSFLMKKTKNVALKFFMLGIINALLPCGLLYVALGTSAAMPSIESAMIYMLLFGLGTFPALFAVAQYGQQLMVYLSNYQKRLIPIITLTMGLFLVVRGIGLGIPYVSPKYDIEKEALECCHETSKCEIDPIK